MARPRLNLHQKVRDVLSHTSPLSPHAEQPITHFERSANSGTLLLKYVENHIDPGDVYGAVYDRHLGHLRRMVLAELIESFERFLKELASICVDHLAQYTTDDRLDVLVPKRGDKVAAFLNAPSVGKALCESDTWLNNKSINERFSSLLKEPGGDKWELLFPEAHQQPAGERDRAATMAILWQVRHNLAHNVGVITASDAMKFRVLSGRPVEADCCLFPAGDDLRYVKRFLAEAAAALNLRVGNRLGAILHHFHSADPALFDAQAKADEVSRQVTFAITINGRVGRP